MKTASWRRERSHFIMLMLVPAIVLLTGLIAVPFAAGFGLSFTDYILSLPPAHFAGFKNYLTLLSTPEFWDALRITLIFTVCAVLLQTIIGLGLAVLLHEEVRGVSILRAIYLLPMAVTPIAAVFTFRMMFNPSLGVFNHLLTMVGLPAQDWLGTGNMALLSLILVDTWQHTPFIILLMAGGLASLPNDPFEAAKIDGATPWQIFHMVTLPLLKPYLAIALLFRSIDAFKTFDVIYVLTAGGPGTSTTTLNLYAYKQAIEFVSLGYASSVAIVMLVIIGMTAQLFLRRSRLLTVAEA